jgi:hypothetical protein
MIVQMPSPEEWLAQLQQNQSSKKEPSGGDAAQGTYL